MSPEELSLLKGKYVFLQPIGEEHREVLRVLAKDDRIWEFTKTLMINETYDAQFDAYFQEALDNRMSGGESFAICKADDGALIGMTRMFAVDFPNKVLEIGHTWYIPSTWGKVYNKECKFLLLQYIFETLHFNRVEFRVAHQNIRSQKAVGKIGGVFEGVLRKHRYRNDGSRRDTVIFSIINDEWPGKKVDLAGLVAMSLR